MNAFSVKNQKLNRSASCDVISNFTTEMEVSRFSITEENDEDGSISDYTPVFRDSVLSKKPDASFDYRGVKIVNVCENKVENKRPLRKEDPTYQLETFTKNYLLIFNQINFLTEETRYGTEHDEAALTETFEKFGFEVEVKRDFTRQQILDKMKTFNEFDFSDYGCVAVAVLTHGFKNGELMAHDMFFNETEILEHLKVQNSPSLNTKPRLLIVQACRGHLSTSDQMPSVYRDAARITKEEEFYFLPGETDILVIHSSYAGYVALRDKDSGSWLIEALCKKIDTLTPHRHLESILIDVRQEVVINKSLEALNHKTGIVETDKQIPVIQSTLIRRLYLRKYEENTKEISSSDNASQDANPSLDAGPSTSGSPNELCPKFLEDFRYIKMCLEYYLENNTDETAENLLSITNNLHDIDVFNAVKVDTMKAMYDHLKNSPHHKYIRRPDFEYYKSIYYQLRP